MLSQCTVLTPLLITHHFAVTLQATSGLSPTTSVISALTYYEYTSTDCLSVTVHVGVCFMLWRCCTKLALHIVTCGGKTTYYSTLAALVIGCSLTWSLLVCRIASPSHQRVSPCHVFLVCSCICLFACIQSKDCETFLQPVPHICMMQLSSE